MDTEPLKIDVGLKAISYQDLLLGFKKPDNAPFTLNEYKTECYRRIINGLYQRCLRFSQKSRLDEFTAKEICQKSILKGFDKIEFFQFDSCWSEEKIGNKLVSWFNKIAFCLFMDLFKERSKFDTLEEGYYDLADEGFQSDQFEFEQSDNILFKLQLALDSLNEREKLIVNLCIEYGCLENNNHLPDDVINDICKSLEISKGNIRVIKLRALKKMKSIIETN